MCCMLTTLSDSVEELSEKVHTWKVGLEAKGLRVNMGKTKCLVSGSQLDKLLIIHGEYPCAVSLQGGNKKLHLLR